MKKKVAELEGAELDYAVAVVQWPSGNTVDYSLKNGLVYSLHHGGDFFSPSTIWAQGGPLIHRYRISVSPGTGVWFASIGGRGDDFEGSTPLIAAMRAFVSSKRGERDSKYSAIIDLPDLGSEGRG